MKRKKNVFKAYKLMGITNKNEINRFIRTDENDGHELVIMLIKQYKELKEESLRLESRDFTPIISREMPIFKAMFSSIGPRQYF